MVRPESFSRVFFASPVVLALLLFLVGEMRLLLAVALEKIFGQSMKIC